MVKPDEIPEAIYDLISAAFTRIRVLEEDVKTLKAQAARVRREAVKGRSKLPKKRKPRA